MLENPVIDDRNINNREHDDEAGDHSNEEEAIAPDGRQDRETGWSSLVWVHVEQRAGEMFDFPSSNEQQEGDSRERCRASAEDDVTRRIIPFVAARAEIAASRADVGDNGEGEETEGAHEEAIDEFVGYELGCENALFDVVRGPEHAVFLGFFETEADCEEGRCDEICPEDLDWR